jgi:PAS domain S-box-containing protein
LAVVPLLLMTVTPYLAGRKILAGNWRRIQSEQPMGPSLPFGDWVEIIGLAIGTGMLGLVVTAASYSSLEISPWRLWGLPLLFVVWASIRRGILGGAAVTAVASIMCLLVEPFVRGDGPSAVLQGNLLAQCITALLVGASVSWTRTNEARYRQVVAHIPVVLYSARLFSDEGQGRLPRVEIIFVSPAARVVLGSEPADLQGEFSNWLSRVHPEDHELIFAAIGQLRLDHRPVTCEYRVLRDEKPDQPRINGEASQGASAPVGHWVCDTLVPHFGAAGQLEGWEGVVADITQQRALSSDLRRATTMLQALVAHLPAGVFFVQGPTGQPILVNARARQLLGQRNDTTAGLDHLSAVYRLFRADGTLYPTEELPVAKALRQGLTVMRDDIVVHRPDGRRIPLVTWAAPIDLGGHGKLDAAVWVMEDLTSLHQAEAARLDSEARLRAVIGTMAEGLIVQSGNGEIVDCNPAACEILGVPASQLRGQDFLGSDQGCLREDGSPFPPDEHPAIVSLKTRQPVRDVVIGIPHSSVSDARVNATSKHSLPMDHPPLTAQPRVKWILASSMPLAVTAEPDQIRVVTTFVDITPQRQALEVLRASEEKYRGLVDSLPVMLAQFDDSLRLIYVNPAFKSLTGYEAAELPDPQAWKAIVHPDDLAKVLASQLGALAGQTTRTEARYRIKDGSEKSFYSIYQPRRQNGEVVGISFLGLDMTHQRRLERDLERALRLELVGRLASGIAHDFNNLLTVILTLSSLAQDQLPPGHPVGNDLRRIDEAGTQASRLAGQLLTFSKHRRLVMNRIDVSRAVRQTLDLLQSSLPMSITLEADLAPDLPPVEGDDTQLQQVLMNLCFNARDAMPDGGFLRVRTALAEASFPSEKGASLEPLGVLSPTAFLGRAVLMSVTDTGHGMEASVCSRIFDPFFSTKATGTGLGLAVVKQIVENFGGRIQVWSEPGQGTRFDVWLPAAATEKRLELAVNEEPVTK